MECSWDKYMETVNELYDLPYKDIVDLFEEDIDDMLRSCNDDTLDLILKDIRKKKLLNEEE